MLGWFWRGWWGTAWGDPAGVWEVWQGGECCHLPGSIQMEIKQDQSCGQICELNLFHRRNKMTQMTPRYMSKFSSSSTRVSRQKRPRMGLMEGRNSSLSPLHFWNSNFSDFLVAGQCRLWSTTKRCTISKIFQPRRQSRLFSASRTFPNSGKLVLKKLQDHSEAGLWKVAQDHSGVWLAVDTGYPLFWPAGPASNYLCTWKLPFRVLTWNYSNVNPHKREWKHWINERMTERCEPLFNTM